MKSCKGKLIIVSTPNTPESEKVKKNLQFFFLFMVKGGGGGEQILSFFSFFSRAFLTQAPGSGDCATTPHVSTLNKVIP